ncbi:hypothetical protein E8E13_000714 [Curvularia kusanoi]|uniref:Uncharacterized protein n=1 Tax=Curvularia kusanoi TaxID=90978 RepID=A0A9P4T2K9_CURKU|nr:hypothetical protein E8E13_000714 [Curvularia kusanoi]
MASSANLALHSIGMTFTRLVRFAHNGTIHYGDLIESIDKGFYVRKLAGGVVGGFTKTSEENILLLCPIESVPIVQCIGLNYRKHATEASLEVPEYPVVITKPADALAGPDEVVPVCSGAQSMLDYEGELTVIVGKDCKDLPTDFDLADYVLGYTAGNDVSARNYQLPKAGGSQFCYAKSFDKFAPIGPWITSPRVIPDPQALRYVTRVNGEVRQETSTDDMIWSIKQIMTLLALASLSPIWTPPHIKGTVLDAFRRHVNRKFNLDLRNYWDLYKWSVDDIPAFAPTVFDFMGIKTSKLPTKPIDGVGKMFPPPRWFPEATMNYAENMLATGLATKSNMVAVTVRDESTLQGTDYTFAQLAERSAIWANALRRMGVGIGDRVATVLPNRIDWLTTLIGAASIGAIFSSTSPDMGATGIVERYSQIRPTIFICNTAVVYGGKRMDLTGVCLVFDSVNVKSAMNALDLSKTDAVYEQLPFDHPVYSSGTTGHPKCITHGAGRALLQQKKELLLGNDINPNCTLYHVTHWGTSSPKFLSALKQARSPINADTLDNLQQVSSVGSPLSVELHHWFVSDFPKGLALVSGSGGTDLVGGIVSESPVTNIYLGKISVPNLGIKVEIWNSAGQNIEDTGEAGDLVITEPFFSMPVGFWTEDGEAKYRAAYFEQYPGVWYHGDFRKNPQTGGYEILGRSDGVLNLGGVRFGSADIYGVVETFASIHDCLCVGQKLPPEFCNEQVLLFLKMSPGRSLDDELRASLRKAISRSLSPRHVPAQIFQVKDIPSTVNGKKIENLVRDIVAGKKVDEARTAINPECLAEYRRTVLDGYGKGASKL